MSLISVTAPENPTQTLDILGGRTAAAQHDRNFGAGQIYPFVQDAGRHNGRKLPGPEAVQDRLALGGDRVVSDGR